MLEHRAALGRQCAHYEDVIFGAEVPQLLDARAALSATGGVNVDIWRPCGHSQGCHRTEACYKRRVSCETRGTSLLLSKMEELVIPSSHQAEKLHVHLWLQKIRIWHAGAFCRFYPFPSDLRLVASGCSLQEAQQLQPRAPCASKCSEVTLCIAQ